MADIRILEGDSPEARLAAVCVGTLRRMKRLFSTVPDYADFRDDLRAHVQKEILLARLEELRIPAEKRTERIIEVHHALLVLTEDL